MDNQFTQLENAGIVVQVPKKKKKLLLVAVIAVVVLLFAAGGLFAYHTLTVNSIEALLDEHNYERARDKIDGYFLPEGFLDSQLKEYAEAGLLLNENKFDEAIRAFADLDKYNDSKEMINESKYRQAAYMVSVGEYDKASLIYSGLSDYKDSEQLVYETYYKKCLYLLDIENYDELAVCLRFILRKNYDGAQEMLYQAYYLWGCRLAEKGDLLEACDKLKASKGYGDAESRMEAICEELYLKMQEEYRNGDRYESSKYIEYLGDYKDTNKYAVLSKVNTYSEVSETIVRNELMPLIGFEDAAEIILHNNYAIIIFLEGLWVNDELYFTMQNSSEGYHYNTNIYGPIEENDRCYFYFGNFYLKRGDSEEYEKIWTFTIISEDCLEIYIIESDTIYEFHRQ